MWEHQYVGRELASMKEAKEHLSVEIIIAGDSEGGPDIEDGSRIDMSIEDGYIQLPD
jgi:hypothetical protein